MANQTGADTGGLVTSIRTRAAAQLRAQKDRASGELDALAQATRESTNQLRSQEHETAAQYLEQAADQLHSAAETIRRKDLDEIARDLRNLARRQPALVIGGGFVAGLVAARFLKSSEPDGASAAAPGWGAASPHVPPAREAYTRAASPATPSTPARITPTASPAPSSGPETAPGTRGRR